MNTTELIRQNTFPILLSCFLQYQINKEKIKKTLLQIPKQGGQRLYGHLPYVQVYDNLKGHGLISKTPIPKNSAGYYGRFLQIIPQSCQCYPITRKILESIECRGLDIKNNFCDIFDFPTYNQSDAYVLGIGVLLGQLVYYGIIAPSDLYQARKEILFHGTSQPSITDPTAVSDGTK